MLRRDQVYFAWRLPFALLGFALTCALVSVCRGSSQSVALTRQAAVALDEHRVADALKKLDEAIAADPDDAQAVFFNGVALNRDGRSQEALDSLDKAPRMGSTHQDMAFERGWALLELEQ